MLSDLFSISNCLSNLKIKIMEKQDKLIHCSLGHKMATMKNLSASTWKSLVLQYFFKRSVVLEANMLEPRSGSTYVDPDLGSSLFAIVQKYW